MSDPPDPHVCENCGGVLTHVFKIERDLAAARARVATLEAERDQWCKAFGKLEAESAKLEAERDRLLEQWREQRDRQVIRIGAIETDLARSRARIATLCEVLEGLVCLSPRAYEKHVDTIHRKIQAALAGEEKP